ncbi:MAG: AmmeMemoRadiSam system protein B [Nitrospira sp.]|nr:AmmeMemoRadiSam system protein B [Nitrospira sp.]
MTSIKNTHQFPLLRNLQFSPLKQGEDQYIVLWDPSGLSAEKLIVPLSYFYLLQFFDGAHSLEQMAAEYLKKFGEFLVPDQIQRLVTDLDARLFLEGEKAAEAHREALAIYRNASVRPAVFAGKGYEADAKKLAAQIAGCFSSKEGPPKKESARKGQLIKGLVAPHYPVNEAGPVYAWAYKELEESQTPDCFVIFGTCQAGLNQAFAVTDKDFQTPLGIVKTDRAIVDALRAKASVYFEEELAHKHEHSIEFQLPFLQQGVGKVKPITIVPILCSFPAACLFDPSMTDVRDHVQTFLATLREVLASSGKSACFVASAELAHIGLRYGDSKPPTDFSFHRCMQTDMAMLKHTEEINADEFARFVAKEEDSRRISGFGAIYSVLAMIGQGKGEVLRYDRGITDQFNSTVTYASITMF